LDLWSHRFEKARELYADHWLGFSEMKLHQFLEKSRFRHIRSERRRERETKPAFPNGFRYEVNAAGTFCV